MSLHDRKSYEAFIRSFPAATLSKQWEAQVGKVGGKVFCLLDNDGGALVFKVSELAFDGLVELPGIAQAVFRQAAVGAGGVRGAR